MNPYLLTRLAVSVIALISSFVAQDMLSLTASTVGLFVVFAIVQGIRSGWRLAVATLLMVLPLVVVHAVINPAFDKSSIVLGVPWRSGGASFATVVALRMALLFLAVGIWMGLRRSVTIAIVAGSRLPASVAFVLLQSILLTHVLARRVASIRLAQESRGILSDGGIFHRAGGVLVMVVPLIAATLMDAHDRGHALARMGVGSARIVTPHPIPAPNLVDKMVASAVSAVALLATLNAVLDANF